MPDYQSMKDLFHNMQDHPVRHALIPLECRLSWPIPVLRAGSGKLYLTAFFYASPALPGQPRKIRRPAFQVTFDPEDGSLGALVNCRFEDFAANIESSSVVGEIRKEDLPALTIPALQQLQTDMLVAYDRILPTAFRSRDQLTSDQRSSIHQFRQILDRLIEPPLRPFYRALNPAFFTWLESFEAERA